MNVPIVQGVAVSGIPNQQEQKYTQAPTSYNNNNDDSTPYMDSGDGNVQTFSNQSGPRGAPRDVIWAVLFVVHLFVMIGIIYMNISGMSFEDDNNGDNGGDGEGIDVDTSGALWLVAMSGAVSVCISSLALGFMMKYSTELVKTALIFSVGMSLAIAVLGLMAGDLFMAIFGFLMFAIGVCYARIVWPRIPFAAANLNTALVAVKANMGLSAVAYLFMGLALVWSMGWFVGLSGALSSTNGPILFLLLLSYYWVHQVLQNTVHVTVAGVIGTWWYVPHEASSCCSAALSDSFCRATTTSFGSICFGSLLVAIVQALRTTVQISRQNDDCQIVTCILDCILGCIEGIIEYLNKWAYVFVALHGFSYIEAGQNVIQLFQTKGWTVVITDDLADNVLFMISLGIGLVTGLISMLLVAADPDILGGMEGARTTGFIIGMVIGYVFASILMSVVASAVNTVIVCFAEAPAEFQTNHPQLSAEMRAAWTQAWPGTNF